MYWVQDQALRHFEAHTFASVEEDVVQSNVHRLGEAAQPSLVVEQENASPVRHMRDSLKVPLMGG